MEANETGLEAAMAFGAYLYDLVVSKRANPSDDLLSRLCSVEVVRDDGERSRLDDVEITGFAALLAAAGSETVTKLVGSAVVLFARYPEEWRQDPATTRSRSRMPSRRCCVTCRPRSTRGASRSATSEFHGVTIPAGIPVILITGAANERRARIRSA